MTDRWRPRQRVGLFEKARGAAARPALKKRAARRRVRLSEKARGAAARPALCKSARCGGASGSLSARRGGGSGSEKARGVAARPAL